jgi:K+ transporter
MLPLFTGRLPFYADGMIAPAISVLSAIRGLRVPRQSLHGIDDAVCVFVLFFGHGSPQSVLFLLRYVALVLVL